MGEFHKVLADLERRPLNRSDSLDKELMSQHIASLEAENAELKTRADEIDEQVDGYRRLCDSLSELVADIEAGDGFYGNDPIEMLVDIRNRHDEIKSELSELREAAAWFLETHKDRELSIVSLQDMGSSKKRAKHESIMREFSKAKRALRALLNKQEKENL